MLASNLRTLAVVRRHDALAKALIALRQPKSRQISWLVLQFAPKKLANFGAWSFVARASTRFSSTSKMHHLWTYAVLCPCIGRPPSIDLKCSGMLRCINARCQLTIWPFYFPQSNSGTMATSHALAKCRRMEQKSLRCCAFIRCCHGILHYLPSRSGISTPISEVLQIHLHRRPWLMKIASQYLTAIRQIILVANPIWRLRKHPKPSQSALSHRIFIECGSRQQSGFWVYLSIQILWQWHIALMLQRRRPWRENGLHFPILWIIPIQLVHRSFRQDGMIRSS